MNAIKLEIEGLYILEPRIFEDERGYFFESFNQARFEELIGEKVYFCQDNESYSHKNVLRGLHFQAPPFAQGKLVRVTQGAVLDVAVDIRTNSPTYGQYAAVMLSGENKRQFWIPSGFAHGFVTLEDQTVFNYKCTNLYHKESEGGLNWNDAVLGIDWGLTEPPLLSDKDTVEHDFHTFKSPF